MAKILTVSTYEGGTSTPDDEERGKVYPQFLAAFAANLTGFIAGCVIGWTSPSLPYLEGPNSPVPITKDENSWISSLMPLGGAFGPFAGGYLADKYGRKKALLFSAGPTLVSWLCLAIGRTVPIIYVARFIGGFALGWIFTVLPMYCGEIAHKSVRGALGSLMQIFIVFGLLFDYCIGPYVPYIWLNIGAGIIPIIFLVTFCWMPETPQFLLMVGKQNDAERSLAWLRKKTPSRVYHELTELQENFKRASCESGTLKDLFATKVIGKAFVISLGLVAFQQLSGINVVLFNAQSIFERAGGSVKPEESAIITGVLMLVASTVTPLIVDRLGRKGLLLISAIGMTVAQVILGLCFFMEKNKYDTSFVSYLPIISVVGYIITYCLGFGPLPWAVMGEMFPNNIKSLASTLTASFCWILSFIVTRSFNEIVETFGNDYTFWLFGLFCALAIPFVYFIMPETKGKTLMEIQRLLA